MMKILTGFAVVNSDIGKKVAYTFSNVDDKGNIVKSNVKESFAIIEEETLNAIKIIENAINKRLAE